MKKIIFALAIGFVLFGCESDEEKRARLIREQAELSIKQDQLSRQQQQAGMNVMQTQAEYAPQMTQQPVQSQPQVVYQQPSPTVVQAPAAGNGMTDMLVGGLIGHAIGSSGGPSRYDAPSSRTVINKTYVNKTYTSPSPAPAPAPVAAPTQKPSYMDMSRLSASSRYSPSSVSKPASSMNMSRLSAFGRRK